MKLLLSLLLCSSLVLAHSPAQLKKYYRYYQLANQYTQKKLKSTSLVKTRKSSKLMCQKITQKFNNDPVYAQVCAAGITDGLTNFKLGLDKFETILHKGFNENNVD